MRYAKLVAALVGGLSPAAVIGVLALFNVHVDSDQVTAILAAASPLLAALGVAVGPANKPPEPASVDPIYAEDVYRGTPEDVPVEAPKPVFPEPVANNGEVPGPGPTA